MSRETWKELWNNEPSLEGLEKFYGDQPGF
jgi:hypothetical protein